MKFDSHVHTVYSLDGADRPRDILQYIKRYTWLDAIAFTDHNRLFSRRNAEDLTKEYGILVVPGIELGRITTGKHIVALNIDHLDVERHLKAEDPGAVIDFVSAQGGLSIAAHPVPRGYANFAELGFDAVEVINGGSALNNRVIRNPGGLPEIGCSDAHIKKHTGRAWTEVEDVSPERFGAGASASAIRRHTEDFLEKVRHGLCSANSSSACDAMYLDYGFSLGKKYLQSSWRALCSLVS